LTGVFAQWAATSRYLPSDAPIQVAGCPVRPAFRAAQQADRSTVLESFGLDPALRTLLVTGASQGARSINDAITLLAARLNWTGWQILHLAGQGDADRVAAAYSTLKTRSHSAALKSRVLPFTDRMAEAMVACDLIVSRAGASTLAEIQAVGRPSILLPYPYHRDQHQRHNALVLAEAGAAMLVDDGKDGRLNADRLEPVLTRLMADHECRARMGRCAMTLDRPDSAETIAGALLAAADGRACESFSAEPVRFARRRSA
jgi:UDP-N-acetylglucosamine--N-acetylmuramyl-(pentapeptide) pyrophosphoryl-undecaprenol N-acetylglucosamine transferase